MNRRDRRIKEHADALARTAQLEMQLEVGDWRDTVDQMHSLLAQLRDNQKTHVDQQEILIRQLEHRIDGLSRALHGRDNEIDRLEERMDELRAQLNGS